MDRINMTIEQYNKLNAKLYDTLYNVNYDDTNDIVKDIPLTMFTINITDGIYMYSFFYNIDEKILKVTVFDKDYGTKASFKTNGGYEVYYHGSYISNIEWEKGSDKNIRAYLDRDRDPKGVPIPEPLKGKIKNYHHCMTYFETITLALLGLPTVWRRNSVAKKRKPSKNPEEKLIKAILGTTELINTYTLIDENIDTAVSEFKNYITYHCLCWGVRGHYRHYKNGKTSFVKAYKKGKKRNEIEPEEKEYRFVKED